MSKDARLFLFAQKAFFLYDWNLIMIPKGYRTWIEIDTEAVINNLRIFRKLVGPKVKISAVVKSNAYGHGLVDFSKIIEDSKLADFLAVDSIVEGLKLRRNGIKLPILVLGYVLPEMIESAVENNISIGVSDMEFLREILKVNFSKPIKIHLKVDTGMYRLGFFENEIEKVLEVLKNNKDKIIVEGLFTHFAAAKNPNFPHYTKNQIEIFKKWKSALNKAGIEPICHAGATAGAIGYSEARFDMVRIGIGLYGLWPSEEVKKRFEKKLLLKPALEWKTVVATVKKIKKGEGVGYDLTEKVSRGSVLALCPIGYWHGFRRALSGKSEVLIHGKRAKVLGRVSMGMIVVDVTDISKVKTGDEVVLIGKQKKEEITAHEMGKLAGTINYEIITGINPLIKKFYK